MVAEEVEVVDTLAVVDAPARIIAQCTELLTNYNCYSSRTDRGKTKYTTEYS